MVEGWPRWTVGVGVAVLALVAVVFNPLSQWPQFGVLALMAAAPLFLHVAGLILVWRTTGLINLAQIQLGILAAVTYDSLARGSKALTIVHGLCNDCIAIPPPAEARALNAFLSAAVVIALTALLSWVSYAGILTRFVSLPIVGLAVTGFLAMAYVGLESTIAKNLVDDQDISSGAAVTSYVAPSLGSWSLAGTSVTVWHLILIASALVVAGGGWWLLQRTTWGLELRAIAERRRWAQELGIGTQSHARRAWLLAGLFAGLAGVLPTLAAGLGRDPRVGAGTWQLVPLVVALTVVILAGRSWLLAAGLCAALSVMQVGAQAATSSPLAIGLVCAVLVMVCVARARLAHGHRTSLGEGRRIPPELATLDELRSTLTLGRVAGVLLVIAAAFLGGARFTSLVTEAAVLGLLVLSVHVLQRFQGRSSLGQVAVAAATGWVCTMAGADLLVALLIALIVGAALQILLLGFVSRVDEMTGAVASLVVGAGLVGLFVDSTLLGGLLPTETSAPRLAGWAITDARTLFTVAMILLIGGGLAIAALRHSHLGRTLLARAAHPLAAESFGVTRWWHALIPSAVAGALAGAAGVLAVSITRGLEPATFSASIGIAAFLYALLGGRGGLVGPALGIAVFAAVTVFFPNVELISAVAAGFGAIAILWAAPGGLAHVWWNWRDATLIRYAHHRRLAVPSLMGDGGAAAASGKALLEERRLPLRPEGLPAIRRYSIPRQWNSDAERTPR